jgi:catechol 2,3-dioxygenase-like lactoylglutathione lyase family enzyme
VDDVRRALEYYRDKLSFDVSEWGVNPEHYGTPHAVSAISTLRVSPAPGPNSAVVPPDMFDVYVYVDHVEALHQELVERGAELVHAPTDRSYGLREIRVRDPHGYVLAFGKLLE